MTKTAASTDPQANAAKIREILVARAGSADLYRTAVAGPSGQRAQVHVGRVAYTWQGRYEIQVITPSGIEAGYAARTHDRRGEWTVWSDEESDGVHLAGWASSLAIAADVLVNGVHVATGRHDSRRTSGGTWVPYVYQED